MRLGVQFLEGSDYICVSQGGWWGKGDSVFSFVLFQEDFICTDGHVCGHVLIPVNGTQEGIS